MPAVLGGVHGAPEPVRRTSKLLWTCGQRGKQRNLSKFKTVTAVIFTGQRQGHDGAKVAEEHQAEERGTRRAVPLFQ